MVVVLFGATGFLGRNLTLALAAAGHEVVALSLSGRHVEGASSAFPMSALESIPTLPDDAIVVHVAAHRYDASRFEMAQSDILTANVDLVDRIFEFCAKRAIKEVRLASSVAVYPAGLAIMDDRQAVDLNAAPHLSERFYAWSKRWAEIAADLYAERYGISTLAFRLSNPYGPYDSLDKKGAHVAPAFVMRALELGETFKLAGDPFVERDFIWVGDVVDVFLKSLSWRGRSEKFNLCTGSAVTLLKLAETVVELAGQGQSIEVEDVFEPAAVRSRPSSAERVKAAFDISAFTSLDAGMRLTMDWYRTALANG